MTKRFHISISVADYTTAVEDYTQRLGCGPVVTQEGRYAMWRTDILNFTISCKPGQQAGMVRHIGFEDSDEAGLREERDHAGLVWEYFPLEAQETEIEEKFPDATYHTL